MSDNFLSKTAQELDAADGLRSFRSEFHLPIFGAVGADLVEENKGTEGLFFVLRPGYAIGNAF